MWGEECVGRGVGECGGEVHGGSVWEEYGGECVGGMGRGTVGGQCGREILSPCQLLEGFVTQVQLGSLFLSAPCPDP